MIYLYIVVMLLAGIGGWLVFKELEGMDQYCGTNMAQKITDFIKFKLG
jgi:hypothetical protein